MTIEELKHLVQGGESGTVEFKKTTGQRSEAARAVCAMLNGIGGFVLIGVEPDGTIVGQELGAKSLEDVSNELARIDPPAFPEMETVSFDRKRTVIVLRISRVPGIYQYDGRAYLRHGATTRIMPKLEYERRLVEYLHSSKRWENEPATGLRIADLDAAEMARVATEAVRVGRLDRLPGRSAKEILRGLGLLEGDLPTNAAAVLFLKRDRIMPRYPQFLLRLARFKGVTMDEFADNRQVNGNSFELLKQAEQFLRDHLPVAGRIVPGVFQRVDEPLYPVEALREVLANAICHRDYTIHSGSIGVAIFDDRVEISSTGEFHFGITIEELSRPHRSRPWNPQIAQTFYRCGIIEAWGRGTLKIRDLGPVTK